MRPASSINALLPALVIAALALGAVPALGQAPVVDPSLLCNGDVPNVSGNTRILHGTEANDIILGGARTQTILGLGGDDVICAGNGKDQVVAGVGNDSVFGQNGKDTLLGGDGDDQIAGGNGRDRLNGGPGLDVLSGDGGQNICFVGPEDLFRDCLARG